MPNRIGIRGALMPKSQIGLSDSEKTIAEVLKPRGYATAIYGKWHLGDNRQFLPTHHGFDEYLGLPYSNDMWPHHPQRKNFFPPLPLIEGDEVGRDRSRSIAADAPLHRARGAVHREATATRRSSSTCRIRCRTCRCLRPIDSRGQPEVVCTATSSRRSTGPSANSWRRWRAHGLDEQTLVIFTSDNGPWMSYGNHAGSPGPLREGKGTSFEGGVRVPFIERWPGRIPRGVTTSQPAMTIDLLPTLAGLAGAPLDGRVDGRDIWPLLSSPGAPSPHDALYFYWGDELHAVRHGNWKLHVPHGYQSLESAGNDGAPGKYKCERSWN